MQIVVSLVILLSVLVLSCFEVVNKFIVCLSYFLFFFVIKFGKNLIVYG